MSVADFMAFFGFLEFLVARSKAFPLLCDVVVGPLAGEWEDEWITILLQISGADAPSFTSGGRTTPRKNKEFNSTMGYPGEDVHQLFLFSCDFFSVHFFAVPQ